MRAVTAARLTATTHAPDPVESFFPLFFPTHRPGLRLPKRLAELRRRSLPMYRSSRERLCIATAQLNYTCRCHRTRHPLSPVLLPAWNPPYQKEGIRLGRGRSWVSLGLIALPVTARAQVLFEHVPTQENHTKLFNELASEDLPREEPKRGPRQKTPVRRQNLASLTLVLLSGPPLCISQRGVHVQLCFNAEAKAQA